MDDRPFSVGPYSLTAKEMVTGTCAVSFLFASPAARIFPYGIVVVLAGGALLSVWDGEWLLGGWLLFCLLLLFVLLPAYRSRSANARNIITSIGEEGLVTDVVAAKAIYRWAGIRSCRRVAGLPIVMVNARCGIVIPARTMSPEQVRDFEREIERRRALATTKPAV